MKTNVGKTDKKMRIMLGALIGIAGIVFQSWWGLAGVVLIITALINWCPIYALAGITTGKTERKKYHGN